MRPPATQRRWFHPDPELARREKRRKEIQELFLKDQDAAREEEEKLMKEKDEMEKAQEGPAPPPASLMEWKELPSVIGALKTVELIGTFSRSIFPSACASLLLSTHAKEPVQLAAFIGLSFEFQKLRHYSFGAQRGCARRWGCTSCWVGTRTTRCASTHSQQSDRHTDHPCFNFWNFLRNLKAVLLPRGWV